MRVLAVDLAARFSAFCVVDEAGRKVLREQGSALCSPPDFLYSLACDLRTFEVDHLIVEDVPPGAPLFTSKAVIRLQGRLESLVESTDYSGQFWYVQPALWQQHYPGVWKGGVKGAAKAAAGLGYKPPELPKIHAGMVQTNGAKLRVALRKSMTDHVDAFLIANWFLDCVASGADLTSMKRLHKYGKLESKW